MIVSTCTSALACPVVRVEQTVLTLVGLTANGKYRIVVVAYGIGATLAIRKKRALILSAATLNEDKAECIVFANAEFVFLGCILLLGSQFLFPSIVAVNAGGITFRIVFLHHPVIIVALHPCHTQR